MDDKHTEYSHHLVSIWISSSIHLWILFGSIILDSLCKSVERNNYIQHQYAMKRLKYCRRSWMLDTCDFHPDVSVYSRQWCWIKSMSNHANYESTVYLLSAYYCFIATITYNNCQFQKKITIITAFKQWALYFYTQ